MNLLVPALLALASAAAAPPAALRVTVLYFDNGTGDPQYDVLRKGLADMIVTDLVAVPGVDVVEREKLQAVVEEQRLQQSRFFDPATAVKTGKLVGASHVVTGAISAIAPRVRLDLRLVDVAQGKVLATSQVSGPKEDLFDLEQQLVQSFVATLHLKGHLPENASGRASADALLAYSKALDQADNGDSKGAQAAMLKVMQASPQFSLAKTRYVELLRKVSEASERRDTLLTGDEAALEARIAQWEARAMPRGRSHERAQALGYRLLKVQLAKNRISQLIGADRSSTTVVPRAKFERLAELELKAMAAFDVLIAARASVGDEMFPDAELPPEDERRVEAVLGERHTGGLEDAPRLALERAQLVLQGGVWGRSSTTVYRPTLAMRDGKQLELALAQLRGLEKGKDDFDAFCSAEMQGEALLRAGRREDAVAAWQRFLDAFPKAKHFGDAREHIEDALYVSPKIAGPLKGLDTCADDMMSWQHLFAVVGKVEGRVGVERLVKVIEGCSQKKGAMGMGWRVNAYLLAAEEGAKLGDCSLVTQMRVKKDAREPSISSSFDMRFKSCPK